MTSQAKAVVSYITTNPQKCKEIGKLFYDIVNKITKWDMENAGKLCYTVPIDDWNTGIHNRYRGILYDTEDLSDLRSGDGNVPLL